MPEVAEQDTQDVEATDQQDGATPNGPVAGLGDAGKQALDRMKAERKAAQQQAAELAAKLKEYEDRDKSELQRAIERAEAAEKRAAENEAARLRSDIARELGVPPRFVVGGSEDEMREAAQEYLDDREQSRQDKARRADVDQGVRDDRKPRQLTRDDLKTMTPQEIAAAKKDGRLSALLTGK